MAPSRPPLAWTLPAMSLTLALSMAPSLGLLCLGAAAFGQTPGGPAPGGPASGRPPSRPAPSPVAPGDLSRPAFDTRTPVYGGGPGASRQSAGTIVAEVEGRAITLGDVGDAIQALPPALSQLPFDVLYPSVIEQLIRQQALVARAQQQGLDEDPVIRRRVKGAADRALANEYLQRELSQGITEAALLARYNRDIAGRPGGEEVRVRIILVATEAEGRDLIAQLRGGADFAALARRLSKDPTAKVGGDLGFNTREGLTAEVGAVAFALAPGQLAPYPVRGGGAWFVVRVEERRERPAPGFAATREQLVQALVREGVAPLTASVMGEAKVREYNLVGKELVGREEDSTTPSPR